MTKMDPYQVLGVARSATQDQIKKAYRKLVKKYHPDRNPGDANAKEQYTHVQHAYDVLSDPKKRAQFDRYGEAGVGAFSTGHNGQRTYEWGGHSSINMEDLQDLFSAFGGGGASRASIFEQMFAGGRGSPSVVAPEARRGQDVHREITLTLEQVVHGAEVTVRLGSGSSKRETLQVKVPPSVKEGQKIRIAGRGYSGRHGGPPGDFFMVCRIKPHSYFTRNGTDISLEVPISITEAVRGTSIHVPTPRGSGNVTIPPGTPSGIKLRLKGQGLLKSGDSDFGDLFVVIKIVPPKKMSDEQLELIDQLERTAMEDPRAGVAWKQDLKA